MKTLILITLALTTFTSTSLMASCRSDIQKIVKLGKSAEETGKLAQKNYFRALEEFENGEDTYAKETLSVALVLVSKSYNNSDKALDLADEVYWNCDTQYGDTAERLKDAIGENLNRVSYVADLIDELDEIL